MNASNYKEIHLQIMRLTKNPFVTVLRAFVCCKSRSKTLSKSCNKQSYFDPNCLLMSAKTEKKKTKKQLKFKSIDLVIFKRTQIIEINFCFEWTKLEQCWVGMNDDDVTANGCKWQQWMCAGEACLATQKVCALVLSTKFFITI